MNSIEILEDKHRIVVKTVGWYISPDLIEMVKNIKTMPEFKKFTIYHTGLLKSKTLNKKFKDKYIFMVDYDQLAESYGLNRVYDEE